MATNLQSILTPAILRAQHELLAALAEASTLAGFERDVAQGRISAVISDIWNQAEEMVKALAAEHRLEAQSQSPAPVKRQRRNLDSAYISNYIEWFNRRETEREYQIAHASSEEPLPVPVPEAVGAAKRRFYSTVAIEGYLYWFMISGLPVQLSPYTEMGMSQTGRIMNRP